MTQSFLATALLTTIVTISPAPASTSSANLLTQTPLQAEFVYTVAENDSLASIAEKYYGDSGYWTSIWNDNDWIANANQITAGWKLKIRTNAPFLIEPLIPHLANKLQPSLPVAPQGEDQTAQSAAPQQNPIAYQQSNFDDVYKAAGAKYGVPWQILYGLHLTETGLRNGHIMNGSGTGAEGPMQFMPGTFAGYAVDGDGDGHADIDNATDAIHTAANYLAKHGSLANGLRSYGGNTAGVLSAARARGYSE